MLMPRYISSQPLWMPAYGWEQGANVPSPLCMVCWVGTGGPSPTLCTQMATVPWARCRTSRWCAAAGGFVSPCTALGLSEIPWCLS